MSDCPSLVKMPSARVAELCDAMIDPCRAATAADLAPFEAKITAEIDRRKAIKRRWFRPSTKREDVIGDLCCDFVWSLNYMFAKEPYKRETVALRLLRATKEADEVWGSVSDLATVSP